MMTKKKVLIIEDEDPQRNAFQVHLENCGFEVYSAGNAADARRLAELHWGNLDVAILDMRLDDPNEPQTTGADIGIEFRQKNAFPPESLIYSAYPEIGYYRLAMKLGAATYLSKTEDNLHALTQHVRVLALRRALNGENPRTAAEASRIAVHSKNRAEAVLTFCRRVLKPEFDICLDVPFVILFTEEGTTQNCADNANLPEGSSAFYHTLQDLAHGNKNLTEPFIFEAGESEKHLDQETALLHEKLNLAAFLPFSLSKDLRLSIGLLHQEKSEKVPTPTDEKALCKLLAQYLRPIVLKNIMSIWSQWAELRATRTSTAKLCLSVGQEINDSLETEELERLEDLADDLNDTGQILIQLESRNWQDESDVISIKEVVETTWERVIQSEGNLTTKLDFQGDFNVQAQRSDLEIIISRLLQWFLYRSKAIPLDVEPIIKIVCEVTDGVATIVFEDNSYRLPKKLREDMFAPFTQAITTPFAGIESAKPRVTEAGIETPAKSHLNTGRYLPLYLAKMLVEGRYHGLLEDHSDEIEGRIYGHRIIMQFSEASRMD